MPTAPIASALALSPAGRLHLAPIGGGDAGATFAGATFERLRDAFARGHGHGLLLLGAAHVGATLPPDWAYFRDFAALFVARLCALTDLEERRERADVPAPSPAELEARAAAAPPMAGAEYLKAGVLAELWATTLEAFRNEIAAHAGTVESFLRERNRVWAVVGRVHFHLAERKADEARPFAFLATFTTRVAAGSRVQHRPLGQAVADSAGARDSSALLALLQPVHRAAERNPFIRELLETREIFHPLAWTPEEAFEFLKAQPDCEAAGVVVRVPNWWSGRRAPRPEVAVTVGSSEPEAVGLDALLRFDVELSLGGERLTADEERALLAGTDGLVRLRGQWVEVDRERLREVLEHWRRARRASGGGISFLEAMRLLAAVPIAGDGDAPERATPDWARVHAGPWLEEALAALRAPAAPATDWRALGLRAELRPYQERGVGWLRRLAMLRLGACLADDMGLGKTLQVLAALLAGRRDRQGPSLLVAPASLLANWQAEIERFAPDLVTFVAHPAVTPAAELAAMRPADAAEVDLVLTSYGATLRVPWLAQVDWDHVVLDEAQAIKNPGAKQTRAVKALPARARIALTGTPVENRLGDLWSLFDFLNPGLLGSAAEFTRFTKRLARTVPPDFSPLRRLVAPYVLRRMKTDPRVIQDLPDKTEVKAFCSLTRVQAALYGQAVTELEETLAAVDGMRRRGVVLAFLMRMKQICNHPSQWLGDGAFEPGASGKFARLAEICESLAARQEKALVFTQFREMTAPLAGFLAGVFGRPGLVLDGATPVRERKALVDRFQADEAVPFFVLSVKAGGTGLNLTAASHVIHFDRWWNPAVEDQATDRAFRIGQRRRVLVHKFVCRGTVEERIDALIESKRSLAGEVLGADGGRLVTEMDDAELLEFVALDLRRATEAL